MFAWSLGSEAHRHEHPSAPLFGIRLPVRALVACAASVEKPIRLRFIRGTPGSQFVRSRLTRANGSSIEPVTWEEENKRRRIGFDCNRWLRCTICVSPCSVPFGKSCCRQQLRVLLTGRLIGGSLHWRWGLLRCLKLRGPRDSGGRNLFRLLGLRICVSLAGIA